MLIFGERHLRTILAGYEARYNGGYLIAAAISARRGPTTPSLMIAGEVFGVSPRWGIPEGMISYRNDNGTWLDVAGDHAPAVATPGSFARDGR